MLKRKFCVEHELRCRSENIIWPLVSTSDGMSKWIADEVRRNGDKMYFRWGELWSNHDIRTATVIEAEPYRRIRMRWDDEEDENAYVEIAVEKSDLTDEYVLLITDFAEEDEIDSMRDLWEADLRRLRHASGL